MFNKIVSGKLYNYFKKRLGMRDYTKGWLKGDCPDCGKHDKFGVNVFKNRSNCFSCGYHPNLLKLVMDVEKTKEYKEALNIIGTYDSKGYLEPVYEQIEKLELDLPEGYTNISLGTSELAVRARNYVKSRRFKVDDVAIKGWGYCKYGEFVGYLIMPYYMGGKLVYYNARKYLGPGSKYKNPSTDTTGMGKSLLIYNADALGLYDEIYLLEGLINAETLGEQAISTAGKKVSDYQLSMINKSPVKSLVILLDPDAIEEAVKLALKLVFFKQVKLVYWEEDKDVNDIGKKETLKRISKIPYMDYNYLLKFKNRLYEGPVIAY